MSPRDMVGNIMAYEAGELTHEEVVEFFQQLINTGLAWTLQGSYGRMARHFIEVGECRPAKER